MAPVANEKSPLPRNDTQVTPKNNTPDWSDKLGAFFHSLSRYYPGYIAFEYGIEWMSPEEKTASMNASEQDDKGRGKEWTQAKSKKSHMRATNPSEEIYIRLLVHTALG